MESELIMSVDDELFLFETFLKLSSQDYSDDTEAFCSEDDSDACLDVPLSDFFLNDTGEKSYSCCVLYRLMYVLSYGICYLKTIGHYILLNNLNVICNV